jgi:hypothetical protein
LYRPGRNTVVLELRRDRVGGSAAAFVDRDVVGFQIQEGMTVADRPGAPDALPLMPFALLTDPDDCRKKDKKDQESTDDGGKDGEGDAGDDGVAARCAGKDKDSWEYQVMARKGEDAYRCRAEDGAVEATADHIPEMRVALGRNGRLVRLGADGDGAADRAARQVGDGVTAADLAGLGGADRRGRLVLDGGPGPNRLRLAGLEAPESGEARERLAGELKQVLGRPRVWMVYSRTPPDEGAGDVVEVVGFVAARVMAVDPDGSAGPLQLVLQPCMLVTGTAVTDHTRRDLGPRTLYNPYVCKVRLVD